MYIARVSHPTGVSFAIIECDSADGDGASQELGIVREIADHPFNDPVFTGQEWKLSDVRLLAPILATKIISLTGVKQGIPQFVFKPVTTIASPNSIIRCPDDIQELYAGSTIAVIIGKVCYKISPEEAKAAILGYTLAFDMTALDVAAHDAGFTRAKSYDGFCPLGPWIDTQFTLEGAVIEEKVNGARSQILEPGVGEFSVEEIISELSHIMTLLPGDTILLPTRFAGMPLGAGSTVSVSAPDCGSLTVRIG